MVPTLFVRAGGDFQDSGMVDSAVSGTQRGGGECQDSGMVDGAVSGTQRGGGEFQDSGMVNGAVGVFLAFDGSVMKSNAT